MGAQRGRRRQSIVARRLFDAERRDEPVLMMRGGLGRRLRCTGLNGRQGMTSESHTGWRYASSFPIPVANSVTMGEGCTPLIERPWRGGRAHFKLEWFAPTGSFKDRGASVIISILREQGVTRLLEDSSGNGGAAIAAYAAAGGIVVAAPPAFDHNFDLPQGAEDLPVEQFISEPGVEAPDEAVLRGTSVEQVQPQYASPLSTSGGRHFDIRPRAKDRFSLRQQAMTMDLRRRKRRPPRRERMSLRAWRLADDQVMTIHQNGKV